jgi:hypothetical protein
VEIIGLKERLLRILILSLFISLIISSVSFIIDKTPPKITNYPTDNFVSLNISKSIVYDDCELEFDTGECDNRTVVEGSSGSGMVFSELETGESLILTAGHFCETATTDSPDAYMLSMLFPMETELTVTDFYGTVWRAEIIDVDMEKDLCLVKSEMPAFRDIRIASSMPKIGSEIYTISAPLSIRSEGAAPHFEGNFSGCDLDGICFFTTPAIFGSSGSLILNSRFEVIGMIQMADPRFPAVGMGVGVKDIRNFLDRNNIDYN